MSADNRTVSTDALATLGTIIDDTQKRDAIHLAVLPMKASATLHAGDHVDKNGNEVAPYSPDAVGIVDPFLRKKVREGDYYWLVIYPRVITSLRHVWAHPAFADEAPTVGYGGASMLTAEASERWLRDWCASHDCPDWDTVRDAIDRGNPESFDPSEYLFFHDIDAHAEIPAEFWVHVENVLGRVVENRPSHFSCSC